MDMSAYIDEIRLKLTGSVLDLELDDETLQRVVNSAFREIQRYIDTTRLATIPFSKCLDLSECHVAAVKAVYRTFGYGDGDNKSSPWVDPAYASQWQLLGGVNGYYNFNS